MAHHDHTPRLCDHCAGPLTATGRCTRPHAGRLAWMLSNVQFHQQLTARLIRDYCRVQQPLWQLVPWLALQADGRTGYLDDTHRICGGIWPIRMGGGGLTRNWVDLETGELVTFSGHPLDNKRVLELDPEQLDASAILEGLRRRARQPDNPKAQAWRAEMAARHGLAPNQPFGEVVRFDLELLTDDTPGSPVMS